MAANRIKGITIEIGGDPKEMIPVKKRLIIMRVIVRITPETSRKMRSSYRLRKNL